MDIADLAVIDDSDAMPLAWVAVMILLTSPSMTAPLDIVWAKAATGKQKMANGRAKSGRAFFIVLIVTDCPDLPLKPVSSRG